MIRFITSIGGALLLLLFSFLIAALCLFPNWDLVSLVNDEGIDALAGQKNSGRVYVGLMSALYFVVNLVILVFRFFTNKDEY